MSTVAVRNRTKQIFRWLQRVFPPPGDLQWKLVWDNDPDNFGTCDWETREIAICPGYPIEVLVETLLHEWTHVRDRRSAEHWAEHLEHDDTFWLEHGRIYRRYKEEGGAQESKEMRRRLRP